MKLGGLGMNTSDELREIADTMRAVRDRMQEIRRASREDVDWSTRLRIASASIWLHKAGQALVATANELDKRTPGEGEV